jgi:hypothetical protein
MDTTVIDNLISRITDYAARCYDIALDADQLKPVVNGKLEFFYPAGMEENQPSEKYVVPTGSAKSQFLTKINIPVSFFDRCPTRLQQQILDHFNTERDYLLRCVEGNHCRAVLSSVFTLGYDNHLTLPIILQELEDLDVELRSFIDNENITRMEIVMTDATVEHLGKRLTPGLMVTNSETGHSSLWIEPIVLIDNSWILASRAHILREYPAFRQIHKGEGLKPDKVAQTVQEALKAAQVGVIQYMEAMNEKLKSEKVLDFVKTIDAFPKRFIGIFESQWALQEQISREEAVREILKAAADLPILSKISVEQATGRWAGIFDHYTKRFEEIGKQIELLELSEG